MRIYLPELKLYVESGLGDWMTDEHDTLGRGIWWGEFNGVRVSLYDLGCVVASEAENKYSTVNLGFVKKVVSRLTVEALSKASSKDGGGGLVPLEFIYGDHVEEVSIPIIVYSGVLAALEMLLTRAQG